MKLYRFADGTPLTQFDSRHVNLSRIVRTGGETSVVYMQLDEEGIIGYHKASLAQLFMVVVGAGWVRTEANERIPVVAGEAVLWDEEEYHEAGTEVGMLVIIIESESMHLATSLQETVLE